MATTRLKSKFKPYPYWPVNYRLAPRALGLVIEWAIQHQDELLDDWELARQDAELNRIAPLE